MILKEKIINNIKTVIRDVPDFPKKGIIFKDITTVLKKPELFNQTIDLLCGMIKADKIDAIVAIESRGFIFGSVIASRMNIPFIPVRKPGKLPAKIISEEYSLEYGTDRVEMHDDALQSGEKVLVFDDLLATGGTAKATCKLVERSGAEIQSVLFFIELEFLNGRQLLSAYNIQSLIKYN